MLLKIQLTNLLMLLKIHLTNLPMLLTIQLTNNYFSKKTIENKTSQPQQTKYIVTKSVSETSSFTHQVGASVTVGTEFEVGVPLIANGKVSVDVTKSYSYTQGECQPIRTTRKFGEDFADQQRFLSPAFHGM